MCAATKGALPLCSDGACVRSEARAQGTLEIQAQAAAHTRCEQACSWAGINRIAPRSASLTAYMDAPRSLFRPPSMYTTLMHNSPAHTQPPR